MVAAARKIQEKMYVTEGDVGTELEGLSMDTISYLWADEMGKTLSIAKPEKKHQQQRKPQDQQLKQRVRRMKVKISKEQMKRLQEVRQLRKELEKTNPNLMETVQKAIKKDILKAQMQSMEEEQTQKKK